MPSGLWLMIALVCSNQMPRAREPINTVHSRPAGQVESRVRARVDLRSQQKKGSQQRCQLRMSSIFLFNYNYIVKNMQLQLYHCGKFSYIIKKLNLKQNHLNTHNKNFCLKRQSCLCFFIYYFILLLSTSCQIWCWESEMIR